MGLNYNPASVIDGLVYYLDIMNTRCYSGTGVTLYNLANSAIGTTIVSGITYDTDFKKNLNFNGSSGYMLSNDTSLNFATNDFTIQTTLKLNGLSNNFNGVYNSKICAGSDSNSSIFQFSGTATSYYQIGLYNEPTSAFDGVNYPFLTNKIYNLTVTKNTSLIEFFVDGVSIGSTTSTKSYNFTGGGFAIGRWYFPGYEVYLKGSIFDFKAYNRAISIEEIKQNYNSSKSRFTTPENIVTNGLVLNVDPANFNSYSGIGNTIYDLSGFGNTGTVTNSPTFSGLNSGNIVLDGTNDYIEIPSISLNTSFTIDMYCNVNNLSSTYVIVGKYGGGAYDFWLGVTGSRFRFSISMPNKIEPQTATISANTWYHVAAVYNASALTASIYLNGVLAQTSNGSSAFQNPPGNYAIGAFGAAGGFYFPGYFSSHKLYNRVLSATEIQQNYNATKGRFGL